MQDNTPSSREQKPLRVEIDTEVGNLKKATSYLRMATKTCSRKGKKPERVGAMNLDQSNRFIAQKNAYGFLACSSFKRSVR